MELSRAQNLKVGQTVHCPADRGDPAYAGKVVHIGTEVHYNLAGVPYVWVSVKGLNHTSGWPSNRLG